MRKYFLLLKFSGKCFVLRYMCNQSCTAHYEHFLGLVQIITLNLETLLMSTILLTSIIYT